MAAAHALAGRIAAAAPAAVSATLQMLRLQLPQHVLQEAALLEAKEQAGAPQHKLSQMLWFVFVHLACAGSSRVFAKELGWRW
jgi:hypothetical protein